MAILKHRGYQGSTEVSLEDGVLHGRLLHIDDLVTYEADTVPALQKAFQEAVDDYLETCKVQGRQPQKPYSGSFNVRIGPELHRAVAIRAAADGRSINDFVKGALERTLAMSRMAESLPKQVLETKWLAQAGFRSLSLEQSRPRPGRLEWKAKISYGAAH